MPHFPISSNQSSPSEWVPSRGLRASHFADLVRLAQIIYDPTGGLSGRSLVVDWQALGVPEAVVLDLLQLGQRYQFSSPHVAPDVLWQQLSLVSRQWFMQNRNHLADLEEIFLARDED